MLTRSGGWGRRVAWLDPGSDFSLVASQRVKSVGHQHRLGCQGVRLLHCLVEISISETKFQYNRLCVHSKPIKVSNRISLSLHKTFLNILSLETTNNVTFKLRWPVPDITLIAHLSNMTSLTLHTAAQTTDIQS